MLCAIAVLLYFYLPDNLLSKVGVMDDSPVIVESVEDVDAYIETKVKKIVVEQVEKELPTVYNEFTILGDLMVNGDITASNVIASFEGDLIGSVYGDLAGNGSAIINLDISNVTNGVLNPLFYSAYVDLGEEGYLDNSGGSDLLTRSQADVLYSGGSSGPEVDPVFVASDVYGIVTSDITNWNTAYGWGNHASAGYITDGNTNWNNSYGFITDSNDIVSGTELDGVFSTNGILRRTGSGTYSVTTDNSANWNTTYGWGNHASVGYIIDGNDGWDNSYGFITGYTETDPVYGASASSGITGTNITNWNTAYGWGNHGSAGYITASSTNTLTNKSGNISQWTNNSGYITDGNTNWDNSYGFITSGGSTDFIGLTDTMSSFTTGSILFTSGSAVTEDNSNFFWDDTNNRLGIGTATPGASLDVVGHIWQTGTGQSVFLGEGAGSSDDLSANQNVYVGYQSGNSNTTGSLNTASGYQSLFSNVSGYSNTAIGANSMRSNYSGDSNTAVGHYALYTNSTTDFSTAIGYQSLYSNRAHGSTAVGYQSMFVNSTGLGNTAVGYQSLYANGTGAGNTATGYRSLYVNSVGASNTAFGYYSLYLNNGTNNTASGYESLRSNTTGSNNTASGYLSLRANNTGIGNSGYGAYSLNATTYGSYNTASGLNSLLLSTSGDHDTASGYNALSSNTSGDYNTASGSFALFANTTAHFNTAIGAFSGASIIDGSSNTFLGYEAGYNVSQLTSAINSMALGNGAYTTASNQVVIGNDSVTQTLLKGNIGLLSSSYINWGGTDGTAGYGFFDNSGTLQFKNSGGSWADLGAGGASAFLDLSDTMASYTTGSILFTSGSAVTEDNSNFFWDDTNNRLGLGTTLPLELLDVDGRIYLADSTAPGTTTNRLYAVGGELYWNGTALGGGSSFFSSNGGILDGGYLEVAHGQGTLNIIATAWVNDGSTWVEIDDLAGTTHELQDNTLVGFYKAEEASGDLDNAEGTATNDLIDKGASTYAQTGKYNNAVSLDGVDDYFCSSDDVTNCVDVDAFDVGVGSFTIGGWIKHDSISTNPDVLASKYSDTSSVNIGDGTDGDIVVSTNADITTIDLISGRTCVDGGDAVNYSVSSLTGNTAALTSTPSSGCIDVGDEILLINLAGTSSAYGNVGNYETLRVSDVSGTVVTFTTPKTKFYGDVTDTSDTNIGVLANTQRVMLQRVPNYGNVTVNNSINFYPDDWNGVKGGVLFFRANGAVSANGSIHAEGKGYRGGAGATTYSVGGSGGETFTGTNGGATGAHYNGVAGTSIAGGGGGSGDYYNGGPVQVASIGTALLGGAGGGGGSVYASHYPMGGGGGGGGYGGGGIGGQCFTDVNWGSCTGEGGNGGVGFSGNGGTGSRALSVGGHYYTTGGGGGGGGTYGDSNLDDLMFGSGGGGAGSSASSITTHSIGGTGGDGGGIVFITADSVTISGDLNSNGGAGTLSGTGTYQHGGGGGAGGSVKLIGNTVNIGSSITTSSGGVGGGVAEYAGGAGSIGRIAIEYATSSTGLSTPTYSGTQVSPGAGGYKLMMNSDGTLSFGIDDDDLSFPEDVATSSSAYDDNEWHHVVVVKKGLDKIAIYVDGVEVASDGTIASVLSLDNDFPFYLGVDSDGSSNPWAGLFDEVFQYNRSLSVSEIEELYQANSKYRLELTDSNTVRLYNNTGMSQELRLSIATQFSPTPTGSSLFTDTGTLTYLSSVTDDLVVGGSSLGSSIFSIDESAGLFEFASDLSANPTFRFNATDGDTADFGFNTNDSFYFTGGNVGIGTTSPTTLLHLVEDSNSGAPFMTIENPNAGASSRAGVSLTNDVSSGNIQIMGSNYSVVNWANRVVLNAGSLLSGITLATNSDINFDNNSGATMFKFDVANSRLGIGTTTPGSLLHISHSGSGQGALTIGDQTTVSNNTGIYLRTNGIGLISTGTSGDIQINPGGATAIGTGNGMRLEVGGNVGIGTSSPSSTLDVDGDIEVRSGLIGGRNNTLNNFHIEAYGGASAGHIYLNYINNKDVYLKSGVLVTSDERTKTNIVSLDNALNKISNLRGVSYQWIDPSRDQSTQVGVIAQEIAVEYPDLVSEDGYGLFTVNYSGLVAPLISAVSEMSGIVDYSNAPRNRASLAIGSNGELGVNTATPSYTLDIKGTLRAFGITDSSDIRLKENITELGSTLDKVLQLEAVNYNWIDKQYGEDLQTGFIAQDVELLFPSLVSTDDDGYKSIAYSKFSAIFAEAIKEQQIIIDDTQTPLNILQDKYDSNTKISDILLAAEETNTKIADLENAVAQLDAGAGLGFWDYTEFSINTEKPLYSPSIYADDGVFATFTSNMLNTGLGLFTVDELGTVVAKGDTYFEAMIYGLDGVVKFADGIFAPEVTSKSYVIENTETARTAGSVIIPAGETEVEISTSSVDISSKILLSPRSNTFGEVVYTENIIDNESFTVKINNPQLEEIILDWWIIKIKEELVEEVPIQQS
jgi:hypothetical protein